ncbi:MAG TPA: hypothetical protein PKA00_01895 [Saprospiraceae bacterium]|nr:hypothetical protein [Saprospiraceae bacterium]HMQ81623.1 hypothetical protein [Saprospiraceae bacterium]
MPTTIIKVYHNTYRKWAKGVRVRLSFDASQGGFSRDAYTDENGTAIIEHSSSGMATVYIDGKEKGRMRTPGTGQFSVN